MLIIFCFLLLWQGSPVSAGESIKSNIEGPKNRFYLDITEMSLGQALLEISSKSATSIVVPSRILEGYRPHPVVGKYTLESALEAVLSDLPFGFTVIEGGKAVSIYKTTESNSEHIASPVKEDIHAVEEVLVLARHRKERALDVPISLNAFSDRSAFLHNLTSLEDIGLQASNTVLRVPRGTNSAVSAFIRGLGQDDPLAGFETGVGVYIDGVYLNRPQTPIMDIYNLESVEILKGPQGTLYGRNTIGGAVKYTTRGIGDTPSSSLEVSYGSYDQHDVVLSGSTPVLDGVLKVGGSVASFQRDGFGENVNTSQENADKSIEAARFNIEIQPNDKFSLRLATDATVDDSNTKSGYRVLGDESNPLLEGRYDTEAGLEQDYHPINKNKVNSRGYSSSIEWKMNDIAQLDMITAQRSDTVDSAIDFNALPNNNLDVHVRYDNEQFSQELRFAIALEKFYALLGYYYLDAKALSVFDTEIDNISNFSGVSFLLSDISTKSNSIFFSSTYDISSDFSVSMGLRSTKDENTAQIERALYTLTSEGDFISPYFGGDGFLVTATVLDENGREVVPRFRGRRKDSSFLPRVSVSWKPGESSHFYLSYSEGYKSGSFDPRADYSQEGARKGFSPETLDTYEFGAKWRGFGNRVQADLAVFQGHYQNIQIPGARFSQEMSEDSNRYVRNSAEADIDGIELNIQYEMNSNWKVSLEGGLLSAQFSKYITPSGNDASKQRKLMNAPEKSISINFDGKKELSSHGSLTAYYNYIYRSDVSVVSEYPTPLYQDEFDISNLGLVWQSASHKYSVGLHAKNVFDEKYLVDGYYYPEFGMISAFYGSPRTITIKTKIFLN